jgi:site-specific DNA-cytosine methylase
VFEFFSGIGGMRLGLPDQIDGKPVTKITAFDCSTIANNVYEFNFHHRRDPLRHPANIQDSKLQTMLVQHLSVQAADNAADIWTMSPPCQPFTQTRRARQLDEKDNRSQGLYHLMTLLLQMRNMPRYIMVENVRGFLRSKMHALWCQVLRRCGYRYHEFLLSPDKTVLLPNSRTRYYCIARFDEKYGELPRAVVPSNKESIEDNRELEFMQNNPLTVAEAVTSNSDTLDLQPPDQDADGNSDDESPENDPTSSQEYGYQLSSIPPSLLMEGGPVQSIEAVLGERYHQVNSSGESTLQQLYVPMEILQSSWASKMLSIARISDCLTYCFTKGYGKRVDHSAGSCLFMDGERELNRSDLPSYYKRIRLFHPDELLLLFGFPAAYAFPTSVNESVSSTANVDRTAKCLTLQHRWGCIGNSVNVSVIRLVMRCLFEDPLWEQL